MSDGMIGGFKTTKTGRFQVLRGKREIVVVFCLSLCEKLQTLGLTGDAS
jgi:hypothetical protein